MLLRIATFNVENLFRRPSEREQIFSRDCPSIREISVQE